MLSYRGLTARVISWEAMCSGRRGTIVGAISARIYSTGISQAMMAANSTHKDVTRRSLQIMIMTTWLMFGFGISQEADADTTDLREYCDGELFKASCQMDEVIVMLVAKYGRMRSGKCLTGEGGVMGCQSDILPLFDLWCSGQHTCEVRISSIIDSIPEVDQPCSMDFRSYAEASYTCVKVIREDQETCISQKEAVVTEPSGYLASVITDETTCGSLDSPWHLILGQGQTIDVELYDFAATSRETSGSLGNVREVCHVYVIIKEPGSTETVCSSATRLQTVYTSLTNELEIRLVTKRKNDGYFLLKYSAKGCADPVPPTYGWVQRQDNRALMGCNASTDTWSATCDGQSWVGQGVNCTQILSPGSGERPLIGLFTGSHWASIVIILAIAVTLGLVIFLVGIIVLRRKRNIQNHRHHPGVERPLASDMYAPQYRDSVSTPYGTKPLSAMDCSSSENDYYRTWQLQRHPPGGRLISPAGAHGSFAPTGNDDMIESAHHMNVCTNPHCAAQRPYDTMNADRRYPMEHIYESPKFDRRDLPPAPQNQTSNSTTASSTQYFELEPEQA